MKGNKMLFVVLQLNICTFYSIGKCEMMYFTVTVKHTLRINIGELINLILPGKNTVTVKFGYFENTERQ